jgi:hypothetical protein
MRADSPRATSWGWYPHHTWVRWSEPENVRGNSHPGRSGQRLVDPSGLATSCGHGHRLYRSVIRTLGRRGGASGCHDGCPHSRPVGEPRWCSVRHYLARADS